MLRFISLFFALFTTAAVRAQEVTMDFSVNGVFPLDETDDPTTYGWGIGYTIPDAPSFCHGETTVSLSNILGVNERWDPNVAIKHLCPVGRNVAVGSSLLLYEDGTGVEGWDNYVALSLRFDTPKPGLSVYVDAIPETERQPRGARLYLGFAL